MTKNITKKPVDADADPKVTDEAGPPADIIRSWKQPVLRRFAADTAGTKRAGTSVADGGGGAHRLS